MKTLIGGYEFEVSDTPATPFGEAAEYQRRWFWGQVERGEWEPNTIKTIKNAGSRGGTYVDIGAWIGPTVLLAAKLFDRVVAYEPDPYAYAKLCENVSLNKFKFRATVELINEAVVVPGETRSLVYHQQGGGSSMTSFLTDVPENITSTRLSASTVPFSSVLKQLGHDDLLKIDVEGYEFDLLTSEHETPCAIWLAYHGPFLSAGKKEMFREKVLGQYYALSSNYLDQVSAENFEVDSFQDSFSEYLLVPRKYQV